MKRLILSAMRRLYSSISRARSAASAAASEALCFRLLRLLRLEGSEAGLLLAALLLRERLGLPALLLRERLLLALSLFGKRLLPRLALALLLFLQRNIGVRNGLGLNLGLGFRLRLGRGRHLGFRRRRWRWRLYLRRGCRLRLRKRRQLAPQIDDHRPGVVLLPGDAEDEKRQKQEVHRQGERPGDRPFAGRVVDGRGHFAARGLARSPTRRTWFC
jgi:hypothetical protein